MFAHAEFSPCRTWRYSLQRVWDPDLPLCAFVGLNPSTANETVNDPTIRRCMRFAQDWRYGGLVMLNLFAFRATDPKNMKAAADPIGPGNDAAIRRWAASCGLIVCAWGNHGSYLGRSAAVLSMLTDPHCLGISKSGEPLHPLYLRADLRPVLLTQAIAGVV